MQITRGKPDGCLAGESGKLGSFGVNHPFIRHGRTQGGLALLIWLYQATGLASSQLVFELRIIAASVNQRGNAPK
jgi:hypothetical protein